MSETNTPTRGVPIMLDRERHLRYSMKTIEEVEEKFGKGALEKGMPVSSLCELLWFGLRKQDPDLTIDMIKEEVDLEHLSEITEALAQATGQRSVLVKALAAAQAKAKAVEEGLVTTPASEVDPQKPATIVAATVTGEEEQVPIEEQ